jgi:hypothetical protein
MSAHRTIAEFPIPTRANPRPASGMRPAIRIDQSCLMPVPDPYEGDDAEPVTERDPQTTEYLAAVTSDDPPPTDRRPCLISAWSSNMNNYPERGRR